MLSSRYSNDAEDIQPDEHPPVRHHKKRLPGLSETDLHPEALHDDDRQATEILFLVLTQYFVKRHARHPSPLPTGHPERREGSIFDQYDRLAMKPWSDGFFSRQVGIRMTIA